MPHPPGGGDLAVGDLGRQHRAGPAGPAGDVGRQRAGERRVRLLEGQQPGGEVAELGLGEPGADRAEVIEPGGPGKADQDRTREVGAGPGAGEPAADQDVGGGQMADLQPVAAALAGLVGRRQPFEYNSFEADFAARVNQSAGLAGERGRHADVLGGQGEAVEQGAALAVGAAQQRAGLPEQVEGDVGDGDGRDQGRGGTGGVHPALQHREAGAVAVEDRDLPVQDHRPPPGRPAQGRGDLGIAAGDIPSAAPELPVRTGRNRK